jgi:transcription-repair coupling factor (superfamily II helicase)
MVRPVLKSRRSRFSFEPHLRDPFQPFTLDSSVGYRMLLEPILPRPAQSVVWQQLYGFAQPLAVAEAARMHNGLTVVLTETSHDATVFEEELQNCLGQGQTNVPVLHFPAWDSLPYDVFSPHPDIASQRLAFLYQVSLRPRHGVVIIPVTNLMQRLPPADYVLSRSLILKKGDRFDLKTQREQLETNGYLHVSEVSQPGEYAIRGGVVDIYPTGSDQACRIELFDDEIESLRLFDAETQRSVQAVDEIRVLPGREHPFDKAARDHFLQEFRERFDVDTRKSAIYQDVRKGILFSGIEQYLPMFFERTATLFDFLPETTLFVHQGNTRNVLKTWQKQIEARFQQRRHDLQRPVLAPADLYLDRSAVQESLEHYAQVRIDNSAKQTDTAPSQSFNTAWPPRYDKDKQPGLGDFLCQHRDPILIAADSPGRQEVIRNLLSKEKLVVKDCPDIPTFLAKPEGIMITTAPLENGTWLKDQQRIIFDEGSLFGQRANRRKRQRRFKASAEDVISNLTDLHPGAPVVHIDHGIGRYRGLEKLDYDGEAEYLVIEYAGGDKLFVPVASLHLVSRYTGASEENAPWHRMGSDSWQKTREKAARKVRDVAVELLDLYAKRAARPGKKINFSQEDYLQFCQGFPFEETEDQHKAIAEVLKDLQSPHSMDRVICGDVGFGKTEVALRAAFAAANDGKQVAVLVPTTLLAQQHYENFLDRFAAFPFRIELLSRFVSKKEADKTLQGLTDGTVDIVIGTHKLLQKDIRFKNLGLVIIDEEHRFGVRQKERLKKLRAEVDILTLTATPIPRTLNTALSGLRELSIMSTPPKARLSVKTQVLEWDDSIIREACQREIQRGGQVYFLHNDVQTIEQMAETVQRLNPDARVRVAHGQMNEHELQQVMLDFHKQRFNILVCSTIIESGIDIPNANTIIINRADKLGLAQLHQLRGRVGRSHHKAFAYLLIPGRNSITKDAKKRLEAIESLEELGSGFTLATHDLEIRGAGELLGDEQSGQIQAIGFSLYCELLERAVKALKDGTEPEDLETAAHHTEVDLNLPALIPDDYIPDVFTRLQFYKKLNSAANNAELDQLRVELIDRFGLLPDATKTLFEVMRLKTEADKLGIRSIQLDADGGTVRFGENLKVAPERLIQLIQQQPERYRPAPNNALRLTGDLADPTARIAAIDELLAALGQDKQE